MTLPRAAARQASGASAVGGPNVKLHMALAALSFFAIVGAVLLAVQVFGDPQDVGPRPVVAIATTELPRLSLADAAVDARIAREEAAIGAEPLVETPPPLEATPTQAAPPAPPGTFKITQVDPPRPAVAPLPRAPIAGLFEPSPQGPLPIVAKDGRTPARAYARPYDADGTKPKIAIVVGGLGFNAKLTQAAIDQLPAEVTLSFMPYAKDLQSWIDKARARGHEVMLEIPMEPYDPAANDTGPDTLLANSGADANLRKLTTVLGKASGYFGVTNYQGAKFATSGPAAQPVAEALKRRGLTFLGNALGPRTGLGQEAARAGLPFASVDRIVDARREADSIDDQLLTLEALALQNGSALGSGFAFPVTIDQIERWSAKLASRGYSLAPASAVMDARAKRK